MTTPTMPTKLEKLTQFAKGCAICPCCEQVEKCVEGCTFEQDSHYAYELMTAAREALKDTE